PRAPIFQAAQERSPLDRLPLRGRRQRCAGERSRNGECPVGPTGRIRGRAPSAAGGCNCILNTRRFSPLTCTFVSAGLQRLTRRLTWHYSSTPTPMDAPVVWLKT